MLAFLDKFLAIFTFRIVSCFGHFLRKCHVSPPAGILVWACTLAWYPLYCIALLRCHALLRILCRIALLLILGCLRFQYVRCIALLLVLRCLCHKYLQKAMRWRPCSELKQSYARKPQPHVGNLKTSACGSVERMARPCRVGWCCNWPVIPLRDWRCYGHWRSSKVQLPLWLTMGWSLATSSRLLRPGWAHWMLDIQQLA